ncbi:unnamed protein product [Ascophyllum nodosum]
MPKKREAKPVLLGNQTHKRRDRAQELRSARRQGVLAKRRKLDEHPRAGGDRLPESWSEEELSSAIQAVRDSCTSQILPHLVRLRKLLSLEYPPVEEVVDRGLAPRLIQLLGTQNDEIQIEVTWCITNIASSWSRHAQSILGATPQLISFLSAPNPALQEQSLWALGNIAGDSCDSRDLLRANGILVPIFRLLQQPPTIEIARTAAWTISNLARGDKTPGTPFLEAAPSVIAALRGSVAVNTARGPGGEGATRDGPLRVEAAWILAFLTAKENETASVLVAAGMVPALVEALVDSGGQDPLCTPALRALGNMVSGAEEWADAVMAHQEFLPCLDAILRSQSQRTLAKEAAWVASNVAAGRSEHRAALVELGTPAALTTLLLSDQLDLQQEAAYGIWNVISHDRDLLAQAAKDDKIVSAFAGLVRAQSPPVVRCALSFLQLVCENVPGGARIVEECGGLEAIDDVHYGGQTDADLREAAGAIVDKFFGEEGYDSSDEEEDDDNSGGGKGGWARNSTQPGDQPFAPLGRGAHLTRPAWMNP